MFAAQNERLEKSMTRLSKKLSLAALAAALAVASSGIWASADDKLPSTGSKSAAQSALADGLYLVVRDSDKKEALGRIEHNERLLLDDSHFLEPSERHPDLYTVLQTDSFVPMTLAQAPTRRKDPRYRTALYVELAPEQIPVLEKFTRQNLGKRAAIVVGGDIVTVHKIKEVIKGGALQITRCTDNACEVLYAKLKEQAPSK
jgi:preprotein translocase subunit SecD